MSEPLIDLRPDHLQIVRGILKKIVPELDVWAFGSRAKWLAKPYSDLDLAIISDTPLSLALQAALTDDFAESDLPFRVDIVDWATTKENFRKIIEQDKVVLQKATPVGRVSPQGVTRSLAETNADVGLRCANPTYAAERKSQQPVGRVSPQGDTRLLAEADVGLRCANPTYAAEWREIAFGDFIALQRGHDLPDQDRRPGNVPILGSFGVTGFHDTVKAKAPGVTVGRSGASFGVAAYTALDYWPLNTALYVTDFKGNDPKFVFYFLKLFDFSGYNSGSAQPSLNRNNLYGIPIQIPAPLIQKHIAEFVSALDDRITLLRETNVTLEAIAQALFKSWFVDFDPVHAKQQGRAPEGMDEATAALFPDRFEESALGLVPMGWIFGTLADLAKLNPESWTAKKHPATVAYIDLANAKENEVAAVVDYPFDEAPSRARRVVRDGDTIVGTVRPGNRSFAYIYEPAENLTASTGFAVLRPIMTPNTEFVYLAATQDQSIEHLAHVADGGAYPAVRPDVVAGIQCVLPCSVIMAAFHDVTAPLLASIAANHAQAQTLATLRDTLLPRLISGQLRLPEDAVV